MSPVGSERVSGSATDEQIDIGLVVVLGPSKVYQKLAVLCKKDGKMEKSMNKRMVGASLLALQTTTVTK